MVVRLGEFANFLIKVKVIGFGGVTGCPPLSSHHEHEPPQADHRWYAGAALALMRKPDQSAKIR
jgi:hypothetical protein